MPQTDSITHRIRACLTRIPREAWVLLGLGILLYARAITGQFIWDDDDYVSKNLALRSLKGLSDIWFRADALSQYYPVTYTSFWLEFRLWGLAPAGYHAVNILLHIANSFLVWRLLDHLKLKCAWIAALIFLVHPVHVESVAWIAERKNVLSGSFYLLSAIAYLKTRYTRAYLFFLCAILSKTVTATLPAALALALWWRDGKIPAKDIVRFFFFLVTAALPGALAVLAENRHIQITGSDEWAFTFAERLLIAGRALWFYLGKLVWPHPLIFIYPRWQIDAAEISQWGFPVAWILGLSLLWLFRQSIGRGPFASLALFTLALFPALGFKNYFPMRFSFAADHFQYLASIPVLTLFAKGWGDRPTSSRWKSGFSAVLLTLLAILTWVRIEDFKDLRTLWQNTLVKNPSAWIARNNLGTLLLNEGKADEAMNYFEETIRLKPDHAEAHANIGLIHQATGDLDTAIVFFREAIKIEPRNPSPELNLGTALLSQGKTDEAVSHYHRALELSPCFGAAHFSLGNIHILRGEFTEAEKALRKAVECSPDFADPYAHLGYLEAQSGNSEAAIRYYRKALMLDPGNAGTLNNLANALSSRGQFAEANRLYLEGIRLAPQHALLHANYAASLEREGRHEEAVRYYDKALAIDPSLKQDSRES